MAPERGINRSARRARIMMQVTFIVPVVILALFVLTAIFAPVIAPHSPTKTSMPHRLLPPFFVEGGSTAYLLGTDLVGRDILSRVLYGARISLSVSLLVIFITGAVGTIVGIIAGYMGGHTDTIIMRTTDASLAIPQILIALLLAVTLGPSFKTVVLAMSILGWAPLRAPDTGRGPEAARGGLRSAGAHHRQLLVENHDRTYLPERRQPTDSDRDHDGRSCDSHGGRLELSRGRHPADNPIMGVGWCPMGETSSTGPGGYPSSPDWP